MFIVEKPSEANINKNNAKSKLLIWLDIINIFARIIRKVTSCHDGEILILQCCVITVNEEFGVAHEQASTSKGKKQLKDEIRLKKGGIVHLSQSTTVRKNTENAYVQYYFYIFISELIMSDPESEDNSDDNDDFEMKVKPKVAKKKPKWYGKNKGKIIQAVDK